MSTRPSALTPWVGSSRHRRVFGVVGIVVISVVVSVLISVVVSVVIGDAIGDIFQCTGSGLDSQRCSRLAARAAFESILPGGPPELSFQDFEARHHCQDSVQCVDSRR